VAKGLFTTFYDLWPTPFDKESWMLILGYMAFELALMRLIPGKRFEATVTATGHVPVYNANGIQCYVITVLTLLLLSFYCDIGIVYDKMGTLLAAMNIFALSFCSLLVFKGFYFPSTKDAGSSGNVIVDFFWGVELYPRIFGFDVKQFTNCRFGMMFWQVGLICYAARQYNDLGYVSSSMLVSVLLQSVYIAKFFWWETGYFCSMDIQHDHAGYYICWGCLVWVPSMYTMHTYFLTKHPILLTVPTALAMLLGGLFCIWCNYDCDRYVISIL
jgi:7-dehydrocholesterol reductase